MNTKNFRKTKFNHEGMISFCISIPILHSQDGVFHIYAQFNVESKIVNSTKTQPSFFCTDNPLQKKMDDFFD